MGPNLFKSLGAGFLLHSDVPTELALDAVEPVKL